MSDIDLVYIVGFVGSMVAIIKPIINLNTSVTELNITLKNTNKIVDGINEKVNDHENRITVLETLETKEHNR